MAQGEYPESSQRVWVEWRAAHRPSIIGIAVLVGAVALAALYNSAFTFTTFLVIIAGAEAGVLARSMVRARRSQHDSIASSPPFF